METKKRRVDFLPLFVSGVACPFKSISSASAARWTARVGAKGYFPDRGEVVTNYEQLITPRCRFVTQRDTIKRAAGSVGGEASGGANTSPTMTNESQKISLKTQNRVHT